MLSSFYAEWLLCSVAFMLSVIKRPVMMIAIMLSVVMLSVVMLNVIMASVVAPNIGAVICERANILKTSYELIKFMARYH